MKEFNTKCGTSMELVEKYANGALFNGLLVQSEGKEFKLMTLADGKD